MVKKFGVLVQAGDAVPKITVLMDFADILSKLSYNALYLGLGESFEIEGEPYFGYMNGRYSAEELKSLNLYCSKIGIELIPAIQTLAHFHSIPCYGRYRPHMDHSHVLLVDDEFNYQFIEKMFASVKKSFSSNNIMIGMDEAHMLGAGRFYDLHGYQKREDILLRHLKKVLSIADKFNFKCEMWSDMFFKLVNESDFDNLNLNVFDNIKSKVPQNVKLTYWNYDIKDADTYKKIFSAHKKITDNIGFAGGFYKWMGFAPDNSFSIRANKSAIKACMEEKIENVVMTMWQDNGGEASIFSILPALYDCHKINTANCSNEFADFDEIAGLNFEEFLTVDSPNKPYENIEYQKINNKSFYYLYADPLLATFNSMVSTELETAYEKIAVRLLKNKDSRFGYIFETLGRLCKVLALKAPLAVKIKKAYTEKDKTTISSIADYEIKEIIKRLDIFFEAFEYQWNKENKSFGFEMHCARIGALKFRLNYVENKIRRYLAGEIEKIEELDEKTEKFSFNENATEDNYKLMCWNNIITHGINW